MPLHLKSTHTLPPRTISVDGVMSIPTELGDADQPNYGTGSFLFELEGASPEDPSTAPGSILTILQRTGDPSSNEVVFFNVSNLFYGDRIRPGTLVIEDLNVSGTNKEFNLTLKDDGEVNLGNIYRDDTTSIPSKYNSVGNIFYDEGIIVLKSPHLSLFGKDHFRITFEGERKVYVFEVSIPLRENLHNSSSNPTYKDLIPTDYTNETAERFTYVTGICLHDDNLNVVGRAHLSQPFVKRDSDRVVVKLRMDF